MILRLGRILPGGAKGPGLFFILPCIDDIQKVDLRTVTFDIAPQEILTKDSVTVTVDGVCYFRVFNPVVSVVNVENAKWSTMLLAATTLRNILGTRTLQEILREKDSISLQMQVKIIMILFIFLLHISLIIISLNLKRSYWMMQLTHGNNDLNLSLLLMEDAYPHFKNVLVETF